MTEFVRVKHKVTGAIASLPKNAVRRFHDWEPAPGPPPAKAKPKKKIPAVSAASTKKE